MEAFIFQRAYSNFRFKLELVASRLILFFFFHTDLKKFNLSVVSKVLFGAI